MTRALVIAAAAVLSACSYDRAFADYCVEAGACSCDETTCCMEHGITCRTEYACCEGLVCGGDGTCQRAADAVLELSPSSWDFGWVDVGETRTLTASVTNAGAGPSSPLSFGDVTSPFRLDAGTCIGQALAPGGTCAFDVSVAPAARGRFSNLVHVQELTSGAQLFLTARSDSFPLSVIPINVATGSILSDPAGIVCPAAESNPCTAYFPAGTQVSLGRGSPLTAGYFFEGFYGDCYTYGPSCSVSLDRARWVYVSYFPNLTLSVDPGGAVTVAGTPYVAVGFPATFYVPVAGTTVLTADPQPPARFAGWSGACAPAGLDASCSLEIAGRVTVTAGFAP